MSKASEGIGSIEEGDGDAQQLLVCEASDDGQAQQRRSKER